jgi:hypothetical protein
MNVRGGEADTLKFNLHIIRRTKKRVNLTQKKGVNLKFSKKKLSHDRVDRSVSEHLRTQRKVESLTNTFVLCFWSLHICSPPI